MYHAVKYEHEEKKVVICKFFDTDNPITEEYTIDTVGIIDVSVHGVLLGERIVQDQRVLFLRYNHTEINVFVCCDSLSYKAFFFGDHSLYVSDAKRQHIFSLKIVNNSLVPILKYWWNQIINPFLELYSKIKIVDHYEHLAQGRLIFFENNLCPWATKGNLLVYDEQTEVVNNIVEMKDVFDRIVGKELILSMSISLSSNLKYVAIDIFALFGITGHTLKLVIQPTYSFVSLQWKVDVTAELYAVRTFLDRNIDHQIDYNKLILDTHRIDTWKSGYLEIDMLDFGAKILTFNNSSIENGWKLSYNKDYHKIPWLVSYTKNKGKNIKIFNCLSFELFEIIVSFVTSVWTCIPPQILNEFLTNKEST